MIVRNLAVILAALSLSSCCQTLWLKVSRRDAAPMSAPLEAEIAPGPIPIPTRLENRFLKSVVIAEADAHAAAGYTDHLDPRDDDRGELSSAIAGLDAIGKSGDGSKLDVIADPIDPIDVQRIECEMDEAVEVCRDLVVASRLPSVPTIAKIEYVDGQTRRETVSAVQGCDGVRYPDVLRWWLAWVNEDETTAPVQDSNPCRGTLLGTRLTLTKHLPPGATKVVVTVGTKPRLSHTALTFVHLSDAQVRDPDVKLTNPMLSKRLDRLIESFEYDEDQEIHNPWLLEAVIATINREVELRSVDEATKREAPSFVIHTGDSIDANTVRELKSFHATMDRLTIPWFNALGNHDILAFGNFIPVDGKDEALCASQVSVTKPYLKGFASKWLLPGRVCVPSKLEGAVGPLDRFIASSDHAKARATFIDEHAHPIHHRVKVIPNRSMSACDGVLQPGPHDNQHGFDLIPLPDTKAKPPGYYAFAVNLDLGEAKQRRGIFIALNSEDLAPNEGGNAGRLGKDQLAWLEKSLACADHTDDLVFLYAHHQPSEILLPNQTRLRAHHTMKHPNIAGYFYGHKHDHGLCRDAGSCERFWEIESGSLVEHPQEGRLVRLKTLGGGIAFFETVTFTERLADSSGAFAEHVKLARRGAARDFCLRNDHQRKCGPDDRVRRMDGRHTNARLFFKLPTARTR